MEIAQLMIPTVRKEKMGLGCANFPADLSKEREAL